MSTNNINEHKTINLNIPKELFEKIDNLSQDKLMDSNEIIIKSIEKYIDNQLEQDYKKKYSTSLRERFL